MTAAPNPTGDRSIEPLLLNRTETRALDTKRSLDQGGIDEYRDAIWTFVNDHWEQVEPLITCPMRSGDPSACYSCIDLQVASCVTSNHQTIPFEQIIKKNRETNKMSLTADMKSWTRSQWTEFFTPADKKKEQWDVAKEAGVSTTEYIAAMRGGPETRADLVMVALGSKGGGSVRDKVAATASAAATAAEPEKVKGKPGRKPKVPNPEALAEPAAPVPEPPAAVAPETDEISELRKEVASLALSLNLLAESVVVTQRYLLDTHHMMKAVSAVVAGTDPCATFGEFQCPAAKNYGVRGDRSPGGTKTAKEG